MKDINAPLPPKKGSVADAHAPLPVAPDPQRSLDTQLQSAAAELSYPQKKGGFHHLIHTAPSPPQKLKPKPLKDSTQAIPPALDTKQPLQNKVKAAPQEIAPSPPPPVPSSLQTPQTPPPQPPPPQEPAPPFKDPALIEKIQETPSLPKKPKKGESHFPLTSVVVGMLILLAVGAGLVAAVIAFTKNPTNPIAPTAPSSKPKAATGPLPTTAPTPTPAQAYCGNGKVESGEQCDDANIINGDGCSAGCQNEAAVMIPPKAIQETTPALEPLGPKKEASQSAQIE